jgi:hypothetical protein
MLKSNQRGQDHITLTGKRALCMKVAGLWEADKLIQWRACHWLLERDNVRAALEYEVVAQTKGLWA